jgi:ribosomal protection tetracycline resistance protein
MEFLAERDEELMEAYLEGSYDQEQWLKAMRRMIRERRIFPCARGSALKDIGIIDFLDKLDLMTVTDYPQEGPFAGRIYKIRHDDTGTRITYIKALQGTLKVRDEFGFGEGRDRIWEKVTQIRMYNGSKYKAVDQVGAGALFGVTGLSMLSPGDGLGALEERSAYQMIPTLKARVLFDPSLNVKEVLQAFRLLEGEDPSLDVTWEENLQEMDIHVMGTVQLEVLEQLVRERFGFEVTFVKPEILYKETVGNSVIGYGHFEPLKHYAEVHLKVEPGKRGGGIVFVNACHPDDLAVGYQNLIRHHIFEREHRGLLTGSPLTDLKITLLNERAHVKHTSGGDFREATFRALRQALEKAENILLEPYYDFRIKVNLDHLGRVLADVLSAYGRFEAPRISGDKAVVTGKVPAATFMNYSSELASYTQGRSTITLTFGGYHPCHNPQEVIEKKGYDKNRDPEYSSSSVFCAKGRSFTVPWYEAEACMHVKP